MTQPPFETIELRKKLREFLDRKVRDPITGLDVAVGKYKFGVYAFFDYDAEPIYVGQTNEKLRARIGRHLTNQRTDAVAMKVLDPFEVYQVEVWPLPQYQGRDKTDVEATSHLSWLEYEIHRDLLAKSQFGAVLNEKDPYPVEQQPQFLRPEGYRGTIVSEAVLKLRGHPDTRLARRAETLSSLAKVVSEREVKKGLRRTLLTQAKRLAWLADRRLTDFAAAPDDSEEPAE